MSKPLARALLCWGGGFLIVASILRVYFQAPFVPLLLAGGVTLAVTLLRYRCSKRNPAS